MERSIRRRLQILLTGTVLIGALGCPPSTSTEAPAPTPTGGPILTGTPLDATPGATARGQRYLINSATYQYNLPSLVGRALYIQKQSDGTCPTLLDVYDAAELSDRTFVRTPADFKTQDKLGAPLYESKITKSASLDVKVFLFGGLASNDDVADVALTDVAALVVPTSGLKDGYETEVLSRLKPTDCDAILVQGATVKTLTAKYYKKIAASGKISGAVFGDASGQTYHEDSQTSLQFLIAIDVVGIRPPPPAHGLSAAVLTQIGGFPATPIVPRLIIVPKGGFPVRVVPEIRRN